MAILAIGDECLPNPGSRRKRGTVSRKEAKQEGLLVDE